MEKRMKPFNRILSFVFVLVLLAACAPKATDAPTTGQPQLPALQFNNPSAPQAGDSDLMVGDLKIDSASVSLAESQPPQVMVNFAYFPPTPCYQLRVTADDPNAQNEINLKAYAV